MTYTRVKTLTKLIMIGLLSLSILTGTLSALESNTIDPIRIGFDKKVNKIHPFYVETQAEQQLAYALYQGLLRISARGNAVEYGDAKTVSVTPDGMRISFELNTGLCFSDGTPITASTYRDSWLRAMRLGVEAPGFNLIKRERGVPQIETDGDYILRVYLTRPASEFVFMVAQSAFAPVHPAFLNNEELSTIGNGPYVLQGAYDGNYQLVKNRLFRDSHLINSPKIEIKAGLDADEATRKYIQKDIDIYHGYLPAGELISNEYIHWYPGLSTTFFAMNTSGTFKDPRIRKALIQIIPWGKITENQYAPATTITPRYNGSYPKVQGQLPNNVREGLDTLRKLGYPNGRGLPTIKIAVPRSENVPLYAQKLVEEIKKVLKVRVKIVEFSPHGYERYVRRYRDLTFIAYTLKGNYIDALSILQPDSPYPPRAFEDKGYTELIKLASTKRGKARLDALAKAESYLLAKGLVVPLYYGLETEVFDKEKFEGWYPASLGAIPLLRLKKQDDQNYASGL